MVVVSGGRGHLGRALACNRRLYISMEANSGSQYTNSPGTRAKQQELSTTQQQYNPWHSVPQRRVLGELQVCMSGPLHNRVPAGVQHGGPC
jgi:hypothetical protein